MTTTPVSSELQLPVIPGSNPIPDVPPAGNLPHQADSIEIREVCCASCVATAAGFFRALIIGCVVRPIVWIASGVANLCISTYRTIYDWCYPPIPIESIQEIPAKFYSDEFFTQDNTSAKDHNKYICPINTTPMRFPVYDKKHPEHVYEKSAILAWLQHHTMSPLCQDKLSAEDLVPHVELQKEIEQHLIDLGYATR